MRTHLWILRALLLKLQKKDPQTYEVFMTYVICMSHPKINRRFLHAWSATYSKSLQDVEEVSFKSAARPPEGSKAQFASDYDFLRALKNVVENHDSWAIGLLAPQLTAMSRTALPKRGSPLFLYTEDTCTEYHLLFCFFLVKYQEYIKDLANCTDPKLNPSATLPNLEHLPSYIFFVGHMLWKMANGYAFEIHLHNIHSRLVDPRRSPPDSLSTLAPGSDPETDPATQCNQDIQATYTAADKDGGVPVWVAYRDWILLNVNYFEAGSTLLDFVCSPRCQLGKPLCIRILVGTAVGDRTMPIVEYLQSEHFPADDETKATIVKFVSKALSLKKQYGFAVKIWTYWIEQRPQKHTRHALIHFCERLRTHIDEFVKTDPTAYETFQKEVRDLCDQWSTNAEKLRKYARRRVRNTINDKIQKIVADLTRALAKYGDVADLTDKFGGTLHCESCLGSLLDSRTRESLADIEGYQRILKKTKVKCLRYHQYIHHILRLYFTGLGNHPRCLETLLPLLPAVSLPIITRKSSPHNRISYYCYLFHSTKMVR